MKVTFEPSQRLLRHSTKNAVTIIFFLGSGVVTVVLRNCIVLPETWHRNEAVARVRFDDARLSPQYGSRKTMPTMQSIVHPAVRPIAKTSLLPPARGLASPPIRVPSFEIPNPLPQSGFARSSATSSLAPVGSTPLELDDYGAVRADGPLDPPANYSIIQDSDAPAGARPPSQDLGVFYAVRQVADGVIELMPTGEASLSQRIPASAKSADAAAADEPGLLQEPALLADALPRDNARVLADASSLPMKGTHELTPSPLEMTKSVLPRNLDSADVVRPVPPETSALAKLAEFEPYNLQTEVLPHETDGMIHTSVGGNGGGPLAIHIDSENQLSLRVGDLLALSRARMDAASFDRLSTSPSANRRVGLQYLRNAGFSVGFDSANEQLTISAAENRDSTVPVP